MPIAAGRWATGKSSSSGPVAVSNTALYWHFVDGIWLIVLAVLYLYPHLLK